MKKTTMMFATAALALSLGGLVGGFSASSVDWAGVTDSVDWAQKSISVDWAGATDDSVDWAGATDDSVDWA